MEKKMNRKNVISIVAVMLMIPIGLVIASPNSRPKAQKPTSDTSEMVFNKIDSNHNGSISLKEFKKAFPQRTRGFDGKTPSFRPPTSRPPSGFDGRAPSFRPPSYSRPSQDSPSRSRSSSDSPSRSRSSSDNRSPDRESRYKEMISKFDKNNDGKLDEKEREAIREYMKQRMSRSSR
jgi:hypothetical protein